MPSFKLVDAKLPEFGSPKTRPELDSSIYSQRFAALSRARRFRDEFADVIRSNNEYVEKHGLPLEKYRLF